MTKNSAVVKLEERTARLTVLIDPRKKAMFERLCAQEDLTPSQVVRRMIRSYIEAQLGRPWTPGEEDAASRGATFTRGGARRRSTRT
jgi:Ribbon-helix-helix protein